MENNNLKKQVIEHNKDIEYIRQELAEIKQQVQNHLPHKIRQLEGSFNNYKVSQAKWMIGILVSIIFTLLVSLLNFLK